MSIVTTHLSGTLLAVKVVAGASRERIVGPLGDRLKVAVQSPAEKGAANRAVRDLLAQALGLPATEVAILRGLTRPQKDVVIRGLAPEEVRRRLGIR